MNCSLSRATALAQRKQQIKEIELKIAAYSLTVSALVACSLAQAQSSVTIYGIVDAAVESVSSGGVRATRVESGGAYQSRLGYRGSEDLGGGLKAIFNLESRFTIDDGASFGGLAFGGRAIVGLQGPWGTVVAGREYIPLYQVKVTSNPFGYNGYGPAQIMMVGGPIRSNNAVRYDSPNFGGFSMSAMYGLGAEDPANAQAGRQQGVASQYSFGRTWVGAGWNRTAVRSAAVRSTDEYVIGVRHNFGAASLYGNYWGFKTDNNVVQDKEVRQAMIGVSAPLYAGGTLLASYSQRWAVRPASADGDDAAQIAIGLEHSLSKRTTAYAHFTKVRNKGASNVEVSDLANAGSAATGFSSPKAIQVGLRHFF